MAAAPLPDGIDGKALKRRLYDEYRVEVPVTWWVDNPLIRVSFQGYNTRADLEALMSALENLLPEMTPAVSAGFTAPA
jgi:isopenicillin-N epimerase